MTHPPTIDIALACATHWHHVDGTYVVEVRDADDLLVASYTYTYADILAFDPQLHAILAYLVQDNWYSAYGLSYILRLSYDHWHQSLPCYIPSAEEIRFITEFKSICLTDIPSAFSCELHSYTLKRWPSGVESAQDYRRSEDCLPHAWFEAHYPGSVVRMTTAMTMGYTPDEVVQYLEGGVSEVDTRLPADLTT